MPSVSSDHASAPSRVLRSSSLSAAPSPISATPTSGESTSSVSQGRPSGDGSIYAGIIRILSPQSSALSTQTYGFSQYTNTSANRPQSSALSTQTYGFSQYTNTSASTSAP